MRTFILSLIAVVILVTKSTAQNRSDFHHIIRKKDVDRGYLPLKYQSGGKSYKICSPKLNAVVTLDKSGKLFVDFWSISSREFEDDSKCISKNTPIATGEIDLNRSTLGSTSLVKKIPFRARSFSIGTIPFKYRFKTGTSPPIVNTVVGVSASYGWTFGKSVFTHRTAVNRSITVGPVVGLTSAELKKETVKSPTTWDAANNRTNLALSYGVNVVLARNNLGLVFSYGFDHAVDKFASDWGYQDKSWFGIGINTNLGLF